MSDKEPQEKKKEPLPPVFTFINAGLSGMAATCVVHPMDVIKNRIQIQKEKTSVGKVVASIYKNEGILKFYSGLSAGLVRQATYTTVRLGIYNQLHEYWKEKYVGKPNFGVMSLMAATAGAIGAFVGTPAEVALSNEGITKTCSTRLQELQEKKESPLFGEAV
ncbi:mitochondrial 2-oxoglutarate/malate carrier protein [Bombus vancouverensis nearcticus]|uniref:mitochondrial 2-oxoglutarate/malate carrier protein n=1 Tax=Bombus vancouverensis nearcticus TaxID=2705178 RepID=UPI00402B8D9C